MNGAERASGGGAVRLVTIASVALRAASIALLLLAAVVLAAGKGEYPALTRAGTGFLLREVVPSIIVALLNLAVLRPGHRRRSWLAAALVADLALTALAARSLDRGAPPVVPMQLALGATLALAAALLLLAGAERSATSSSRRPDRR